MTSSGYQIDPDAILESIVEIRFTPEGLPEIPLGRMLSSEVLAGLEITRLPEADIPFSARQADPSLFVQSMYQAEGRNFIVRIGLGAISFHVVAPYPGWGEFSKLAISTLRSLWNDAGTPPLQRYSLRYINALTAEKHGIHGIEDMNLTVNIGSKKLVDLAVSFCSETPEQGEAFVRIASAKHVNGQLPEDTSFVVDIDVRSENEMDPVDFDKFVGWLDGAREMKNQQFFCLLPDRVVNSLKAD